MSPELTPRPPFAAGCLLFLLPPLAALMLAGVYTNYRAAMLFVRTAYDQQLGDAAVSLEASILTVDGELRADAATLPNSAHRADHLVALRYSILGPQGRLLAGSPGLPSAPASVSVNPTFADAAVGGESVRVATYRVATAKGVALINVAEASDARAAPGHFILASTWLIDFVQLDVTLLIVWIGVYYGLKPLVSLRRQIEAGSARELKHLDASTVPAEVQPTRGCPQSAVRYSR